MPIRLSRFEMPKGVQVIDGLKYYFDAQGYLVKDGTFVNEAGETLQTDSRGVIMDEDYTAPPENTAPICACGEQHTGLFAPLLRLFHSIIYFFRNLFK